MQIITLIAYAMDTARRKFTLGEQSMLIDIFNGTMLAPGMLGQHLTGQVEDSFALYPGLHEEKWGVEKTAMLEKIESLDSASAIFLELWAVGFWALNTAEAGQMDDYIAGQLTLASSIAGAVKILEAVTVKLEGTRSSFKSSSVAEARTTIELVAELFDGMILD